MPEVVIFGGTTEGRELAEYCGRAQIPALVCVATPLGTEAALTAPGVDFHVGRLGAGQIADLLAEVRPTIVVDATHPYATDVTRNVASAASRVGVRLVRVARSGSDRAPDGANVIRFPDLDALIDWLNTTSGVIFATTGAKEARALTRVRGFADRLFLRLLPVAGAIAECAALGYPTAHLIAMQGPFSEGLNVALFRHSGASILVTKDSGDAGGVAEKLRAAAACQMTTAMLDRPGHDAGVPLDEACRLIAQAVR